MSAGNPTTRADHAVILKPLIRHAVTRDHHSGNLFTCARARACMYMIHDSRVTRSQISISPPIPTLERDPERDPKRDLRSRVTRNTLSSLSRTGPSPQKNVYGRRARPSSLVSDSNIDAMRAAHGLHSGIVQRSNSAHNAKSVTWWGIRYPGTGNTGNVSRTEAGGEEP